MKNLHFYLLVGFGGVSCGRGDQKNCFRDGDGNWHFFWSKNSDNSSDNNNKKINKDGDATTEEIGFCDKDGIAHNKSKEAETGANIGENCDAVYRVPHPKLDSIFLYLFSEVHNIENPKIIESINGNNIVTLLEVDASTIQEYKENPNCELYKDCPNLHKILSTCRENKKVFIPINPRSSWLKENFYIEYYEKDFTLEDLIYSKELPNIYSFFLLFFSNSKQLNKLQTHIDDIFRKIQQQARQYSDDIFYKFYSDVRLHLSTAVQLQINKYKNALVELTKCKDIAKEEYENTIYEILEKEYNNPFAKKELNDVGRKYQVLKKIKEIMKAIFGYLMDINAWDLACDNLNEANSVQLLVGKFHMQNIINSLSKGIQSLPENLHSRPTLIFKQKAGQ